MKKIKLGTVTGPFLLLILAAGFAWASGDDLYVFIRLFERIAVTVSDRYVENLDSEKLIYAGIDGMMEKLDPYSKYLTDKDYYYLLQETSGEYSGIGIEMEKNGDSLWVSSVIKDTPASRANIRVGDRILAVDTVGVLEKSIADCRKLLRGNDGSQVVLKLWRPLLKKELVVEMTREEIHIEPVPYWFVDSNNSGYIKISRFSEGSALKVKSIIGLLEGKNVSGLIIDLRDNPGGLLYESVEIAALFLNQGDKIVETKSREGLSLRTYEAREDGICKDIPVAVLINGQTASAAEIVAGAIQDNDRGLIIGSSSYGKGLVQQILQFSDQSALKLTTAKYYTPSERCIQKKGYESEVIESLNGEEGVVYFTKSGRPVFGGGGIVPDIYVEPLANQPIIDEIVTNGYVNDFVSEHSIGGGVDGNFQVGDKLVDQFVEYVNRRGYLYHNAVFSSFDEFTKADAESPDHLKYHKQIESIQETLTDNARSELAALKPQLKDLLYEYFLKINLGEKQAYELAHQHTDPEITRAGQVLKDPEIYSSLLAGY